MKAEYKIRGQWVSEEVALKDFERRVAKDLAIYGIAYIEDLGGGLKRIINPEKMQVRTYKKPLPWYRRLLNRIKRAI